MTEEVALYYEDAEERMKKAVDFLVAELAKLRAGKASTAILDGIVIDYYGSTTPLSQVANLNTPDARTIVIQPWEKKMIPAIEKAIFAANIGLTPMNNGEVVRLSVPPLTEERRKGLVKQAKGESEVARVSLRNTRRETIEIYKKMVKQGLSEDLEKDASARIDKLTETYSKKIEEVLVKKEEEIMTI